MHPIRTSIICCSIMLTAWLTASYTTQLEPSRNRSNGKDAVSRITVENQENVASATSAPKENRKSEENPSAPIAHVK